MFEVIFRLKIPCSIQRSPPEPQRGGNRWRNGGSDRGGAKGFSAGALGSTIARQRVNGIESKMVNKQ